MSARIDHTSVSGTFSLDGQTFDVDNNVWVVGDDAECVVIDAPHAVEPILDLVAGRKVVAVLCTHAHDDHVRVAPALAEAVGAPILLHPHDLPLWRLTHGSLPPDGPLLRAPSSSFRFFASPRCAAGRSGRSSTISLSRRDRSRTDILRLS